jgi:hypothetical protein
MFLPSDWTPCSTHFSLRKGNPLPEGFVIETIDFCLKEAFTHIERNRRKCVARGTVSYRELKFLMWKAFELVLAKRTRLYGKECLATIRGKCRLFYSNAQVIHKAVNVLFKRKTISIKSHGFHKIK